jgi:hypothetical protein
MEMLRLQREKANRNVATLISKAKVPFPDGWHAYIDLTGETLKASNYQTLIGTWRRYIIQKKLKVSDPDKYIDEAVCVALQRERGNNSTFCAKPQMQSPDNHQIDLYRNDTRGPKDIRAGTRGRDAMAWKALHLASLDNRLTQSYLDTFTSRIGCGSCKSHWKTILRNTPPVLSPNDGAFDWTVKVHNIVSQNLTPKKPVMDLGAARNLWANTH